MTGSGPSKPQVTWHTTEGIPGKGLKDVSKMLKEFYFISLKILYMDFATSDWQLFFWKKKKNTGVATGFDPFSLLIAETGKQQKRRGGGGR